MPERPSPDQQQPLQPFELPPDLAEFFLTQPSHEFLCVLQGTSAGTAFVLRLPRTDIEQLGRHTPIRITHELYPLAQAPVLRTIVELYVQPTNALVLETFTNVGDEEQTGDFARLGAQQLAPMLFYDKELTHRRTKVVPYSQGEAAAWLLQQARYLYAATSPETYDFDAAKERVMRYRRL